MKQTKWCTPARVLAVAFVCLAALSCGDLFTVKGGEENKELASDGTVVPEGYELVRMSVAKPESRELGENIAKSSIDYYEVIFRTHGSMDYYSGSANEGEYLSVAVPPDQSYDVLLLAGIKKNRVLLASAYINQVAGSVGSYSIGGPGWKIEKGKVNSCRLTLEWVVIDPAADITLIVGENPASETYTNAENLAATGLHVSLKAEYNAMDIIAPNAFFADSHLLTKAIVDTFVATCSNGGDIDFTNATVIRKSDKQIQIIGIDVDEGTYGYLTELSSGPILHTDGVSTGVSVMFSTVKVGSAPGSGTLTAIETGKSSNALVITLPSGSAFRPEASLHLSMFDFTGDGQYTYAPADMIIQKVKSNMVVISNLTQKSGTPGTVTVSETALTKGTATGLTVVHGFTFKNDGKVGISNVYPYSGYTVAGIPRKSEVDTTGGGQPQLQVTVNGVKPLLDALRDEIYNENDGTIPASQDFLLVNNQARIKPYDVANHTFVVATSTQEETLSTAVVTSLNLNNFLDAIEATYTFDISEYEPDDAPEKGDWPEAPSEGSYGLMYFNMTYAPYNDAEAGRTWNIRNGFNYEPDQESSNGSAILLRIGDDPGDFKASEDTEIQFGF
ncbi:MAG: hypothetical protein LBR16_08950 [Treponema sp.]|jgi:hypothetical protein|nr:hypothetical protein [Treponema sp.]